MNELNPLRIPDEWELWRIEGRKHHEVVTHIAINDAILCGTSRRDMVFDNSPILLPTGHVYDLHGRTTVIHALCRKCLRKALRAPNP